MQRTNKRHSKALLARIAALHEMETPKLKEEWRKLFGTEPPRYKRGFLIKRLAYRLQELEYGGLDRDTRGQLDAILDAAGMDELASPGAASRRKGHDIPPVGTLLVRQWKGEDHQVLVLADGFEYQGRRYKSLWAVARAITGTRWNGWVFFGLKRPGGEP